MMNKTVKSITLTTLSHYMSLTSALFLCAIAVVITGLIPPLLLKQLIDGYLYPGNLTGLSGLTLIYILVLFGIGLADFLKGIVLTSLGQRITYSLRSQCMSKMHHVDSLYFTSTMEGETVSRIINDTDAIDILFTGGIVSMMIDLLKIVGIVFSIFLLSVRFGIITLILIPLIALITRYFQKGMLGAQKRSRALIGRISQQIAETLHNTLVIKANGHEYTMMERFKTTLKQHYFSNEAINVYDSFFPVVIQITKALAIGVIILSFISNNNWFAISIGSIAAVIELISNLFDPIENVGSELQSIQQAVAAIARLDDYLAQSEELPKDELLDPAELLKQSPACLKFDHVSFSYEDHQPVLKDINLEIRAGQHTTFVGKTGVGKSTLLKLVLGLLPPDQGHITLNGVDVSKIPHRIQRQIYGSVDQNFPLIKGSLQQQITLGDPDITSEKVLIALAKVGLKDLCYQSEQGIDAIISSQLQLSEGQKQLVAIARAIVMDPPILILDEISSGLDALSDAHIHDVLNKVTQQRIVLSVTHRLSSINDDEQVVILQDGVIRSTGLAQTLKETDPWFKKALLLEKLALK